MNLIEWVQEEQHNKQQDWKLIILPIIMAMTY